MKSVDFLQRVYGNHKGWIDLPTKSNGHWIPCPLEWPAVNTSSRRIRSAVRDREDLYFSVAQFKGAKRRLDCVLPTKWLWADLDTVHPSDCIRLGVTPTVCWQSSPGRYQALWELNRKLKPQSTERLNRMLTYAVGADRSGWDLTQVLRVPGTKNFKYPDAPSVKMVKLHGPVYDPKELLAKLQKILPDDYVLADSVATRVPIERRDTIPPRALRLINASADQVVEGERSSQLWLLECLLAESGWDEEEIYSTVYDTAWNKWKDVGTGEERLRREVRKAIGYVSSKRVHKTDKPPKSETHKEERVAEDKTDNAPTLSPVSYATFMSQPRTAPKWLVEEIWTAESHGIMGGEPKTSKSTLALALGLSVASGKPFLGEFPVGVSGPVLMIQEENSDWVMEDRIARIASSYGLISPKEVHKTRALPGSVGRNLLQIDFPQDIDFHMVNHMGFDLTDADSRSALESDIARIRPVLVILDPLYLMIGSADENRSADLRPYLMWLLSLRYEYHTALCVVHHFRKQNAIATRAGQRLMGSAMLHGWVESALYCEALETELGSTTLRVRVEREFRNVGPRTPIELSMRMGEPGDLQFSTVITNYTVTGEVETIVDESPGITARQLADMLNVDKRTALKRARGSENIVAIGTGTGRGNSIRLYAKDHPIAVAELAKEQGETDES